MNLASSPAAGSVPPDPLHASDVAARNALVAIVVLFVCILIAGWHKLIAPSLGSGASVLAWALAVAVAMIALATAVGVAAERVRLHANAADGPGRYTWVAYLGVLFMLSALGTMNTAIYFLEGRAVLEESVSGMQRDLADLQARAEAMLATPKFDMDKKDVLNRMNNVAAELTNEANCGYGKAARQAIEALKQRLPAFTELSGTLRCRTEEEKAKLRAVISAYRDQVDKLLKSMPSYAAEDVEGREGFLAGLRQRVKVDAEALQTAKDALLLSNGGASGMVEPSDPYGQAQRALQAAARTYADSVAKLQQLKPDAPKLAARIGTDAPLQLGSVAQVVPFVLGRLNKISTYVYVLAAVMLDFILVACVIRVLRSRRAPTVRASPAGVRTDLTFLWVPPTAQEHA